MKHYEIYKNLGTANEAVVKERASAIIGMNIDEMIGNNIVWTRPGSGIGLLTQGVPEQVAQEGE